MIRLASRVAAPSSSTASAKCSIDAVRAAEADNALTSGRRKPEADILLNERLLPGSARAGVNVGF